MAKFIVVGTILDAENNKKLSSASVSTDSISGVKSNKNGYYEIEFDSEKDNGITVEKEGYWGVTTRAVKEKGDLTLKDIKLEPNKAEQKQIKSNQLDAVLSDLKINDAWNPKSQSVSSKEADKPNAKSTDKSDKTNKKNQYVPITAGGVSAVALGGIAYLMSKKIFDNKWGQLAVTATSAVVFYFVGFNVTQIIQNKQSDKK